MSKDKIKCQSLVKEHIFRNLFGSEQEAIECCEEFQNIDDLWTFFNIAQFCYFLDKIDESYNKANDYLRVLLDTDRLIMIASVIELLNSRETYKTFEKWIKQQKKKEEHSTDVIRLFKEYHKIHGAAEKFRNFFDKFLTKDEKVHLMKSIQFWRKEERSFLPLFCFKVGECNFRHSYCEFDGDKARCPIYASELRMRRGIEECANFLYALRSRFVHEAKLANFPRPLPKGVAGSSSLIDYVDYAFLNGRHFRGTIKIDLFSSELVKIGRKYLTQMMSEYVKVRAT
jgi:hypothetical protein